MYKKNKTITFCVLIVLYLMPRLSQHRNLACIHFFLVGTFSLGYLDVKSIKVTLNIQNNAKPSTNTSKI